MTTREQLYAAIVAEPGDDTLRLAYADFLDEQENPSRVKCKRCGGKGEGNWWGGVGPGKYAVSECFVCHGTGCIPDTSDRDRAEFIRLQVAIDGVPLRRSPEMPYVEWERLKKRADELLATHFEWKDCPCQECGGKGWVRNLRNPSGVASCPVCGSDSDGGTGDLLRAIERTATTSGAVGRPHQFARGFVDSVTLTIDEALRFEPLHCAEPSPLLLALVRSLPLTRVYLSDGIIRPSNDNDTYYAVWLGLLPGEEYWHELEGHPTPQAARDALARFVCRLARERAVTRA